jgi:glycosyltransferase involved in cell wall biosynthesis
MRIVMLEEFSRLGGGQELFRDVYDSISKENRLLLITGRDFSLDLEFEKLFKTSFSYRENMSKIILMIEILRLRRSIRKIIKGIDYDLAFNNHPNIFIFKGDINYLHGFSFLDPIIDEQGNIINTALFRLIRLSGIYSEYNDAMFLTHGKYTMDISKNLFPRLNINYKSIKYINTPVRKFYDIDLNAKKDVVLTFGRINRDKNLEIVLNAARSLSAIKFIIAGAVNRGDEHYYEKLKRNAPSNVRILENPDENEKIELFKDARVYLHTKKKEHYGITVAEAISFGCIPVVPKSGGPWIDIVDQGRFGFGYDDVPDEVIKQALGTGSEFARTIYSSRDRFAFSIFREKIRDYFQEVAEEKVNKQAIHS